MKKLLFACFVSTSLLVTAFLALSANAQKPVGGQSVTGITPASGPDDRRTEVTITGQGFAPTSQAWLDQTELLDLIYVDAGELQAVAPFGMAPGVYTLSVTNPDAGILTNAYTVTQGSGAWASGGPYGGRTRWIAIHPTQTDIVFVAAEQSGLYRTDDGGQEWELVAGNSGHMAGPVAVHPNSPDTVFFGGTDGLYRSDEAEEAGTWSRVDLGSGVAEHEVQALAIAASSPYTIYCSADQLMRSIDGGQTWQTQMSGLSGPPNYLAIDPRNPATVYAGFGDAGTIYRSQNSGQSWTQTAFNKPLGGDGRGGVRAMAADPYRDNTLWVGTWQAGMFTSPDRGQNFSEVTSIVTQAHQSGFWTIRFDPNQDRLFVGLTGPNDALYYSDNGATSWTGLGLNNEGGADVAVVPGDSQTIYTSWAGIRKSSDEGQSWTWLAEGMTAVRPWSIAVSPSDPARLLAVADSDGAFGSQNSGNLWSTYAISADGESHQYEAAAFDPANTDIAYIGGTDMLFKTQNGGQSWQKTADMPLTGLPANCDRARPLVLSVHPDTPATVYAGVRFFSTISDETIARGALYRSDNRGDSWTRITAADPISSVKRVVFAPSDSQVIYLATGDECHWCEGEGIWRSRNGGQTWAHPDSELSEDRVLALAVDPRDADTLLAAAWSGSGTGRGVFRSTDGGNSWQTTAGLDDSQEMNVADIAYHLTEPDTVYAATHAGLRISFDAGQNWQTYPGEMGGLPITALGMGLDGEDVLLYLGTVGGTGGEGLAATADNDGLVGAGVYMARSSDFVTPVFLPLLLRNAD